MPNYFMNKVFIEAKYQEALLFNDMRVLQEIIRDLKEITPEAKYDDNQKTLIFMNNELQFNIVLNKNRLEINCDSPIEFYEFKKYSQYILNIVVEKLYIENFQRIGMRAFRGIEKINMGEANKYIWKNFIKIREEDLRELGNVKDCGVNFTIKSDEYSINLGISPNFYQVIKIVNGEVKDKVEKPEIMIDSDIFLDDKIEVDRVLNRFIDDVIRINETKINEFIKRVGIY